MAYKDLKSMFVTYMVPTIETSKTKEELPEFNRWNHLQNLMIDLPKQESKEEPKQGSEIVATYDNQVEENPWTIKGSTKITKARRINNKQGYQQFQSQLDEYLKNNPQYEDYRDMLTNIAAMESSFNQYAVNPASKALGYFQFLDNTRKDYNNMSRQEFANDSQAQFESAIQHLKYLKKRIQRNVDSETIANSNLTPLQLMYGMWWRPKTMENYLNLGFDNFRTSSDNMDIIKILEKAS